MENIEDRFPELTDEGRRQAQDLMTKFEIALKEKSLEIMEGITTDFYCNILNEVEGDQWTNYRTKILNHLCDYRNRSESRYDFDRIRKSIYENHKDEIIKDLNQDLVEKVEELTLRLDEAYRIW